LFVTRLITWYILWSIRLRIPPWWYFQINAEFFNPKKGYYSKLEIDEYIPEKWRLKQNNLDNKNPPKNFPVFIKPEWGQNANSIEKINSLEEFGAYKSKIKVPIIVQEIALGKKEFEIFYIQDYQDKNNCITLKITETINNEESYPINSIGNKNTYYQDISHLFSSIELEILKKNLKELPCFRIARLCIRADSKKDLLEQNFKIIEINLFAPMPLTLLDKNISKKIKRKFIKTNMFNLVKVSATTPKKAFNRFVFFKKIIKHYQVKN
jgi:hypothetical protein